MDVELKGKRLLVLGSTSHISDIVEKAQAMGIYVIVSDYNSYENAPAKQIANEYWDISLADVDALSCRVKEDRIDGVLTGFTDSYLAYYLKLCEATHLPCYGDQATFKVASNKESFKLMCDDADVSSIPGRCLHSHEELDKIANELEYPVIFKPIDNSGSRGVVKCNDGSELQSSFSYAMSHSPSHNVLCERFME